MLFTRTSQPIKKENNYSLIVSACHCAMQIRKLYSKAQIMDAKRKSAGCGGWLFVKEAGGDPRREGTWVPHSADPPRPHIKGGQSGGQLVQA